MRLGIISIEKFFKSEEVYRKYEEYEIESLEIINKYIQQKH